MLHIKMDLRKCITQTWVIHLAPSPETRTPLTIRHFVFQRLLQTLHIAFASLPLHNLKSQDGDVAVAAPVAVLVAARQEVPMLVMEAATGLCFLRRLRVFPALLWHSSHCRVFRIRASVVIGGETTLMF